MHISRKHDKITLKELTLLPNSSSLAAHGKKTWAYCIERCQMKAIPNLQNQNIRLHAGGYTAGGKSDTPGITKVWKPQHSRQKCNQATNTKTDHLVMTPFNTGSKLLRLKDNRHLNNCNLKKKKNAALKKVQKHLCSIYYYYSAAPQKSQNTSFESVAQGISTSSHAKLVLSHSHIQGYIYTPHLAQA